MSNAKFPPVFVFDSVTHPDEEVNGPITDYIVVNVDPNPVLESVLRPDEQRTLVERMGGVREYHCPIEKTRVRKSGPFATTRDVETVPPDLYEKWYSVFMESKALRDMRIEEAGAALREAQSNFDRAIRLFKQH